SKLTFPERIYVISLCSMLFVNRNENNDLINKSYKHRILNSITGRFSLLFVLFLNFIICQPLPDVMTKPKKGQKQKNLKEPVEEDTTEIANVDLEDEEVNSGFGSYLRSSTGQETLKLFVIVNSLVMFLTIAWPQMKTSFEFIKEIIIEYFGPVDFL
ncbi:CLUMA_CG008660, isoform A, partial [Clunio marinus]